MNTRELRISAVLRSRPFALLLVVAALAAGWGAYIAGAVPPIEGDTGLCLPSANLWISNRLFSFIASMAANCVAVVLMVYLNRAFNLLRTVSVTFAGMFLLMQAASPLTFCQFSGGTLFTVIALTCMAITYSTYMDPLLTRRVFLVFCMLGAGALTQYPYIAYMAVFLVGCVQMRAFKFRTFLAAVVGIVVPLWILWGFGGVRTLNFPFPDISAFLSGNNVYEAFQLFSSLGLTLIVLVVLWVLNSIKIYSYNARARAFNGLLSTMSLVTALLCVIDFVDMAFYIPMLNCCAAFQIGHFFRINARRRGYLVLLGLILLYSAIYIWVLWD